MSRKRKKLRPPFAAVTVHQLDWLEWISIGLSLWLWIFPYPYKILFTVVLLLPIVGLILNGLSRPSLASLVSVSNSSGDDKYDIADFIEIPGWVLVLRVLLDFEFESFYSILKVGTAGFILLLLLLSITHKQVDQSNKNKYVIYFAVIGNIALYSYAATYGINCVYDNSEPLVYESRVIEKTVSRSRRSTIYYIKVQPWGYHREAEKIKVSADRYREIEPGQTVAIDYREGLLGIPWYYIE